MRRLQQDKKMINYIKKILLTLLLSIAVISCSAQRNPKNKLASKKEFEVRIDSIMNAKFNIIKLPTSYYDCGYKMYKKGKESGEIGFNMGVIAGKKCLSGAFDKLDFSDGGLKMFKSFRDFFIYNCINDSKKKTVRTMCTCLYKQYVNHKIGYERLLTHGFRNSKLNKKIASYCLEFTRNK